MSCGGPALNAYKKTLNTPLCALASNDEMHALTQWFTQAAEGNDVRSRVAVTGSNISRGTFGLICIDLACDELGAAFTGYSSEAAT